MRAPAVLWVGPLARPDVWDPMRSMGERYCRVVRLAAGTIEVEQLGTDALGEQKWDAVRIPGDRTAVLEAALVDLHAREAP